ncbi:HAD-IA family hydrolase [Sphingomonas morindae]|uniref:HAD-IA family hydrolase n=1 Tax=Sphingomonas morindae TaxID=1541170 RepID=A0ABY4XE15_9SPHN|nr:HAD-IA family hydrolase [Sphingomonas morindae]USI75011.1 HAD-IA family hydrolase [Sphingomonas morindae]
MSSPWSGRVFEALLFDMDGTLLTSIKAANRVWGAWARAKGLDVEPFLATIHGARAVDTVRSLGLPGVDAEAEAARITEAELDELDGIEAIGGAVALLASLPAERWAIVTSAPRALALRRLAAAGLPLPEVIVTADDVARGKPAPDGFLLAAERLGHAPAECLVFEDTRVGLAAAEAAGMATLLITATHSHAVESASPRIADYAALRVEALADGRLRLVDG